LSRSFRSAIRLAASVFAIDRNYSTARADGENFSNVFVKYRVASFI
jgi:hypothetical protein